MIVVLEEESFRAEDEAYAEKARRNPGFKLKGKGVKDGPETTYGAPVKLKGIDTRGMPAEQLDRVLDQTLGAFFRGDMTGSAPPKA